MWTTAQIAGKEVGRGHDIFVNLEGNHSGQVVWPGTRQEKTGIEGIEGARTKWSPAAPAMEPIQVPSTAGLLGRPNLSRDEGSRKGKSLKRRESRGISLLSQSSLKLL